MIVRLHLLAKGAVFILLTWAVAPVIADDSAPGRVTFYKDVLPILQESCQICHRPGGNVTGSLVAPMSFMNYKEVRPWAKAILKQVTNRTMPPYFASQEFRGVFEPDRGLSDVSLSGTFVSPDPIVAVLPVSATSVWTAGLCAGPGS